MGEGSIALRSLRYSQEFHIEKSLKGEHVDLGLSDITWVIFDESIPVEDKVRGKAHTVAVTAQLPTGERITIGACPWDDGYIDVRTLAVGNAGENYHKLFTSGRIGIYETPPPGNYVNFTKYRKER